MAAALAVYTDHARTLRSKDTSIHHAQRIAAWAEKYTCSQARECAAHITRDMTELVEDKKTGELKPAYAPATVNRSLAVLMHVTLKPHSTLRGKDGIKDVSDMV